MALYLGDTEVAPVVEVPVPEKRYNVGINNLLGTVDENGMYVRPTEPFTPDFSGIKSIPYGRGFAFKFYYANVVGDLVFDLEELAELETMISAFVGCYGITSVSFPRLVSATATRGLQLTFDGCDGITNVLFPALAKIGSQTMTNTFRNCTGLKTLSFPALTEVSSNSFGGFSFEYAFNRCTALTEIHFRADAQATIEAITGYADKWGATNATIYFDL